MIVGIFSPIIKLSGQKTSQSMELVIEISLDFTFY